MNIDSFLAHHGLAENPFNAEEARHDPVFHRVARTSTSHPDFHKILGRIDSPSTSIVFGEKGSGKTAIRLMIDRKVAEHNQQSSDRRTLLIAYDDLNPLLDRVQQHHGVGVSPDEVVRRVRLADHQDAILSLAVTRLVDALLTGGKGPADPPTPLPAELTTRRGMKRIPRRVRTDLAILAAIYDQPASGSVEPRWRELARLLRVGASRGIRLALVGAVVTTIAAVAGLAAHPFVETDPKWPLTMLVALLWAGAIVLWGWWGWQQAGLWWRCRRIRRDLVAVDRTTGELMAMLGRVRSRERRHVAMPGDTPEPGGSTGANPPTTSGNGASSGGGGYAGGGNYSGGGDVRYQMTRRLLDVLGHLGYSGMIVLVDRVDEPTLISGNAQRMRSVIWPMFDNKFLQQDRVGLILLLPIELRYMVQRESAEFFQHARLDKQSLIDRLSWSGTTLYDLCSARMRACRASSGDGQDGQGAANLTDLFEPDVTRAMLIDALDQMHQPRDAFKFLYAVIQEHCRTVAEDEPAYRIPRLILESVRKAQSQRVQELFRGLAPA